MRPVEPDPNLDPHRGAEPLRASDAEARLHIHRDDAAALEVLFHAEYDCICRFIERYVRTSAVAEELAQEIFLKVWRRREMLPPAAVTRAYLFAAARNAAVQHVRHERVDLQWRDARAAGDTAEPGGDAADAELAASELGAAAERAIASLPERCRTVFTLSRHQGLRYSEIAEALGISVGTVEIHMNRAFRALRTKLAPFLVLLLAAHR